MILATQALQMVTTLATVLWTRAVPAPAVVLDLLLDWV
jgi:hypothetical protein